MFSLPKFPIRLCSWLFMTVDVLANWGHVRGHVTWPRVKQTCETQHISTDTMIPGL